jgi:hypothetical protein
MERLSTKNGATPVAHQAGASSDALRSMELAIALQERLKRVLQQPGPQALEELKAINEGAHAILRTVLAGREAIEIARTIAGQAESLLGTPPEHRPSGAGLDKRAPKGAGDVRSRTSAFSMHASNVAARNGPDSPRAVFDRLLEAHGGDVAGATVAYNALRTRCEGRVAAMGELYAMLRSSGESDILNSVIKFWDTTLLHPEHKKKPTASYEPPASLDALMAAAKALSKLPLADAKERRGLRGEDLASLAWFGRKTRGHEDVFAALCSMYGQLSVALPVGDRQAAMSHARSMMKGGINLTLDASMRKEDKIRVAKKDQLKPAGADEILPALKRLLEKGVNAALAADFLSRLHSMRKLMPAQAAEHLLSNLSEAGPWAAYNAVMDSVPSRY